MNVSDFTLSACFIEARLDLSADDNVIALALAGYPARPYTELIRSDIPGPSNLRSARSSASRSLPAAALGSSPIGLTAATPTRGEILVHLGAAPRKPRNVKRKKPSSTEEDRPVSAKVQKLGASPTAREPERASSPLVEAPVILSPPISSKPDGGAKSPLNAAAEQSLVVMPITVWNPPLEKVQSPPRKAVELKRKKPKAKVDENQDSLLSNPELAAGAVSSILRDSDLGRSKAMLVDEALALSLQGVASVSLQLYLLPCCLHVER